MDEAVLSTPERSTPLIGSPAWVAPYARVLVVFLATLGVGLLGIAPPSLGGRLTLWLLGSGVAVAAVYRWGALQCLPVYAANVLIDVISGRTIASAIIASVGLPVGALLTVWLLRRYGLDSKFERGRDVPIFIGAAALGMALTALIGAGTYSVFYPLDPLEPWHVMDFVRWWLNDLVGVLLVAPLLVALRWTSFEPVLTRPLTAVVCIAMLIALVLTLTLGPPLAAAYGFAQAPVLMAATVLVVIFCLRFGLVPAAAAALVLSLTEAYCLAFNLGVFRDVAVVPGLVVLWSSVCAMVVSSLLLTWLVAEQRRLERRYSQVFEICPQPLWVYDQATLRFLLVNAATERQYGWSRSELLAGTIDMLAVPGEERLLPALAADAAQAVELRHRTRSGAVISVEVWARLIDYGGQPASLVFAFDVSERKALESALVNAVSAEQRRLGQELHDGLAQELFVASLLTAELAMQAEEQQLPISAELEQLTQRINACIGSARTIAHGLSPLTSSRGDLAVALKTLARASTIAETGVEVVTHIEAELRLPLESRNHLYRIAQEAVQNALKHADAHQIEIRFTVRTDRVQLEILDDGRGIDAQEANTSGFGTNTMRYRSSAIGGRLSIGPRPGGGTMVVCSVPQPVLPAASLAG